MIPLIFRWIMKTVIIQFIKDFGILLVFCIIFILFKGLFLEQGSPNNWPSFSNVVWLLGLWTALTCYPAFLIGIRIKKSPAWFFVLSWITVAVFFCLSLYLSTDLTYKVGDTYVYDHGKITSFGIVYKLSSPRVLMALWATWLFGCGFFCHGDQKGRIGVKRT